MPVYVLRAGETDKVKIGWAKDTDARRAFLRCGHYEELRPIRVMDGNRATEAAMHRLFAQQRIRNEWFVFHPDMLTAEPKAVPEPSVSVRLPATPVESLIDKAGGTREFAKLLGVARTTILDWKREGLIPGVRVAQICSLMDIPAQELFPIIQPPRRSKTAARRAVQ